MDRVKERLTTLSNHLHKHGYIDPFTDAGYIWLEDMKDFLYGAQRFYRQEVIRKQIQHDYSMSNRLYG
jgi:uncharacterized protein YjgD (DUF1641 family)